MEENCLGMPLCDIYEAVTSPLLDLIGDRETALTEEQLEEACLSAGYNVLSFNCQHEPFLPHKIVFKAEKYIVRTPH